MCLLRLFAFPWIYELSGCAIMRGSLTLFVFALSGFMIH